MMLLLQVDDEELRNMITADPAMRSSAVLPTGTDPTLHLSVIDLLVALSGKNRYLES
jgi:hypothetical protein